MDDPPMIGRGARMESDACSKRANSRSKLFQLPSQQKQRAGLLQEFTVARNSSQAGQRKRKRRMSQSVYADVSDSGLHVATAQTTVAGSSAFPDALGRTLD